MGVWGRVPASRIQRSFQHVATTDSWIPCILLLGIVATWDVAMVLCMQLGAACIFVLAILPSGSRVNPEGGWGARSESS